MPALDCLVRDKVLSDLAAGGLDWDAIPLIVPERGTTKDLLDDWLREEGIRPRIYAQVAGHEAIVAMVSLGLGVGIAPQLVIESSGPGQGVDLVPVTPSLPMLSVGLAALRHRLDSSLVSALWGVAGQTYTESV
jgi:LysR family positive regulator for ilvC